MIYLLMGEWHRDRFKGMLAAAAWVLCVSAAAKAQPVRWQTLPQASPAATVPASGDLQWKALPNAVSSDAAAEAVQWQAVSEGDSGSGAPNAVADPVQWVVLDPGESEQLEQTLTNTFAAEPTAADDVLPEPDSPRLPTSEQLAKARFRGLEPPLFRSVSRNITYGDTLYPEMGFWIPNMFRQARITTSSPLSCLVTPPIAVRPTGVTGRTSGTNAAMASFWQRPPR